MPRCTLLFVALLALAAPAAGDPGASAAAATGSSGLALVPLPPLPSIEHPAPAAAAVQSLTERVDRLLAMRVAGPVEPRADFGFLAAGAEPLLVPAVAERMDRLRRSLDGNAAKLLLERARNAGKKALHKQGKANKRAKKGALADADEDGDWLQFVLALHRPDNPTWRGLCELYGLMRVLEAVGTTPAFRELIETYAHFGELVRIDLQRIVERHKDNAVAALIEARGHDAKKVRDFARRELDAMGRALPGEAVAIADPDLLADVLCAFGRTRDVDAARVILSFIAADKVQLRMAARAALVAIGEHATWQLREAYESATGQKPPRSWDHRRLAQELFALDDRSRAAAAYALMDQGVAAQKRGDASAAVLAFDQVLARSPLFERRAEMTPAYLAYAREKEKGERFDDALVALRKALRLDPAAADRAKTESRIAYLEGKTLALRGTPDPFIVRRALALDPSNDEAKALLASFDSVSAVSKMPAWRCASAVGVGLAAAAVMVWLARWERKRG